MRKGKVTDVVTKCGHPEHTAPIIPFVWITDLGYKLSNFRGNVLIGDDRIEDTTSELHHTQRVFESFVCCSRVNQRGQCQLSNVAHTLVRARIQDPPFS